MSPQVDGVGEPVHFSQSSPPSEVFPFLGFGPVAAGFSWVFLCRKILFAMGCVCAWVLMGCLCSCMKYTDGSDGLVSIQILDRNGFSETVSVKERLKKYEETDFQSPQPYQKVVRIFGNPNLGKTSSLITTYHENGQLCQYLEVKNGRACGSFVEWYPSGVKKLEAQVIAGTADLSTTAQMSWLFDGESYVYDLEGHLMAKIGYRKGVLEGSSLYYHPNGILAKEIPYEKDEIHGMVHTSDETGSCMEQIPYVQGELQGEARAFWPNGQSQYRETYERGRLMTGRYFDPTGSVVSTIDEGEGRKAVFEQGSLASLVEYRNGIMEGEVQRFNPQGQLSNRFHIKNGVKNGAEWEYSSCMEKPQPKLYLEWKDDRVEGTVQTWYENGEMESQTEMQDNYKHGSSFGWFKGGDLMYVEEYEHGLLTKGTYFKKRETQPVSKIENGGGIATLFDPEGKSIRKIPYEKGIPRPEP